MDGRRIRALGTSMFLISGVLSVAVSPTAAATCTLTAPASVAIGSALTIEGAGFPASTAVDVSITIEGGSPDEFTAQSGAAGTFAINLTPEESEKGDWTVTATAGAGCSAQVVIKVGTSSGGATPGPSNDGAAGAGAGSPPPRTDSAPVSLTGATGPGISLWLALSLLSAGIGGLILTKPARGR